MFVVSEADRAALSRYRDKEIFLAPNGVEPWAASAGHLARWRRVFGADVARFGLYVASGHPPNFLHFFQVFGDPLGFLAPDEAICIAGGASSQIESMLRGHRHEALVRSRLRFLGQLNNRDLSAIKELAHVFVLPIIEGSGSNLKTAEALYSRAWVVGTPVSFRGFEKFMGLPNVIVASPGKEFCDAVRYAMDRDCPVLSEKAVQSLSEITWENTLAGIPAALGHLKW